MSNPRTEADLLALFADLAQDNAAQCRYCNWRADHPKAFRMRTHAALCPGLPPDQLVLLRSWNDERQTKKAERDKNKKAKSGTEADTGPGPGPLSSGDDDDDDDEDVSASKKKIKRARPSDTGQASTTAGPSSSTAAASTFDSGLHNTLANSGFPSGQSFEVAMGGSTFR